MFGNDSHRHIFLFLFVFIFGACVKFGDGNQEKFKTDYKQQTHYKNQHPPVFFHVKNIPKSGRTCGKFSPEVFFDNVGHPSLSLLYHRGQALFGVLMDKIEASYSTSASDFKEAQKLDNKTKEQWSTIAKTVSNSWDSTIDRLETEWEYFILIYDMQKDTLLPWEISWQSPVVHERLARLEYGYLMVEAVVKTGIREIIGTLQHQLGGVIRKLEEEVEKIANKNEDVTPEKLGEQMKKGFSKMKPSFTTKLMEKVITKSLESPDTKLRKTEQTFVSEALQHTAIVFHAFREKGQGHLDFWSAMSAIFEKEFGYSIKLDEEKELEKFVIGLNKNQDKLINLIVEIFSKK